MRCKSFWERWKPVTKITKISGLNELLPESLMH